MVYKRPDTHKGLPRDEFRQVQHQELVNNILDERGGEITMGRVMSIDRSFCLQYFVH